MPELTEFFGIPPWEQIAVYVILMVAAIIMLVRLFYFAQLWWKVGRPEVRWDKPLVRLGNVIKYGIAQVKVLQASLSRHHAYSHVMGFLCVFCRYRGISHPRTYIRVLKRECLPDLQVDFGYLHRGILHWCRDGILPAIGG